MGFQDTLAFTRPKPNLLKKVFSSDEIYREERETLHKAFQNILCWHEHAAMILIVTWSYSL